MSNEAWWSEGMRMALPAAKGTMVEWAVDASGGTFRNGRWLFLAAFAAAAVTGFGINVSIGRWEKHTLLGAWLECPKNELLFALGTNFEISPVRRPSHICPADFGIEMKSISIDENRLVASQKTAYTRRRGNETPVGTLPSHGTP